MYLSLVRFKKECKKCICKPIKSVTYLYVHMSYVAGAGVLPCLCLYLCMCLCLCLEQLKWGPVNRPSRSAGEMSLCGRSPFFRVICHAPCISRIHIPAPNLFPHTSTERSAEIRRRFLDIKENLGE